MNSPAAAVAGPGCLSSSGRPHETPAATFVKGEVWVCGLTEAGCEGGVSEGNVQA